RAFRLEWMPDPWSDVDRAGEWLRDIADRERVDVVHLNGYSHAALEWTVPVLVVAHSCVTSWWRAVHDTRAPAEWDEYRARVLAGLRCAGRVVAPTRAMLRALEREYEPIESGVVIPNGCTTLSTGARRKEDFILSAGRVWDEAKNITLLDAAAPSVPWTIRVAGEATAPDGSTRTPANVALMGRLSGDALIDWMERA